MRLDRWLITIFDNCAVKENAILEAKNICPVVILAKGSKGALTVAAPPSFASQWLIPRISRFSAANPDIDVKLKAVDDDELTFVAGNLITVVPWDSTDEQVISIKGWVGVIWYFVP